jgi:hypothetical protein
MIKAIHVPFGKGPKKMFRFSMCRFVLLAFLMIPVAHADTEILTPDGRRVLLKDDFTWKYLTQGAEDSAEHVLLSIEKMRPERKSCVFGLRLVNNMATRVKNVVPQFRAYNRSGVVFETVYQSFTNIKPTLSEYQEIRFSGIRCDEIERVQVVGADRCTMGELTKYSRAKGECLKLIRVQPSDLATISK